MSLFLNALKDRCAEYDLLAFAWTNRHQRCNHLNKFYGGLRDVITIFFGKCDKMLHSTLFTEQFNSYWKTEIDYWWCVRIDIMYNMVVAQFYGEVLLVKISVTL